MSNPAKPDPIDETIKLIETYCKIFKDEMSKVWVSYSRRGIRNAIPVKSEMFKLIIRKFYFKIDNSPASKITVNKISNHIESLGLFSDKVEKVFIRNAVDNDSNYYIDLGNEIIKITPDGFSIANRKQAPNFFQPAGFKNLPIPSNQHSIEKLRRFINVNSDIDFRLLIAWILAALNPTIPTPILILQGEQGSAKSTLAKVLRSILDPNEIPLRQCPASERDMFISASNSAMVIWDNLSSIPDWASDSLCRLCTGGGFSTRKLYTDSDETLIHVMRPIIVNGIDTIATRGDLLDRAIVLNLPLIPKESRMTEKIFWEEFYNALPEILSSIYSSFSYGLSNYELCELNNLPRMADFAKWSCTCCNHFDWPKNIIIDDYITNRKQAIEASISNNIFAQTLLKLLENKSNYENNAENFISDLEELTKHKKLLPFPNKLKDALTRFSPILRELGYEWSYKRTNAGGTYIFSNSNLQ